MTIVDDINLVSNDYACVRRGGVMRRLLVMGGCARLDGLVLGQFVALALLLTRLRCDG